MNLQRVGMFVCAMRTPNDMSELEKLLDTRVAPEMVVALVGKTEGTGLHNDWGRVVADQAIRAVLASRLGTTRQAALRAAGLSFGCCPSNEDRQRVVQVFAKACIPGSDLVRGQRVTLLDDHDAFHVAKALGGELVASVTGRTTVFVSGGERNSHQGPPGGNPVAAVVRSGQTTGGA